MLRLALDGRNRSTTSAREAPSKNTSLRRALKEPTARNQLGPEVDDRHCGATDVRAWNQLTPLEWGPRRAGHLAGFTVLLRRSLASSESGRGER
jgi:hypothetical protein